MNRLVKWLTVGMIIAGFFFGLRSICRGDEALRNFQVCKREWGPTPMWSCPTSDLGRKAHEYEMQYTFHLAEGRRNFQEAQDLVWYCPRVSDREKAKDCWLAASAGLLASTPMTKVIAIVGSFLTEYGLECMEEWNLIDSKFQCAAYHYEIADHYLQLLNQK